jgi:hypothetical protein
LRLVAAGAVPRGVLPGLAVSVSSSVRKALSTESGSTLPLSTAAFPASNARSKRFCARSASVSSNAACATMAPTFPTAEMSRSSVTPAHRDAAPTTMPVASAISSARLL